MQMYGIKRLFRHYTFIFSTMWQVFWTKKHAFGSSAFCPVFGVLLARASVFATAHKAPEDRQQSLLKSIGQQWRPLRRRVGRYRQPTDRWGFSTLSDEFWCHSRESLKASTTNYSTKMVDGTSQCRKANMDERRALEGGGCRHLSVES